MAIRKARQGKKRVVQIKWIPTILMLKNVSDAPLRKDVTKKERKAKVTLLASS